MNAIRNYLDNMFRNLPNTEEVRRAKTELLEMMEDKYEELISEGKSENEAVGIVISEFGNLDELAESLGITEAVTENPSEDKPMLSMDRVKEYLSMVSVNSIIAPLAIALCIFSVAMNIIEDMLPFDFLAGIFGVGGMFSAIAIAVGLFIVAGVKRKEFAEVKKKECSLSIECAEYVRNERKRYKSTYGLMSSFGIGLCILSVLNPIIFDKIPYYNSGIGTTLFFAFIAVGVFLITSANTKMNGYDRLLELNEAGKMSEEFVPKADRKVNKAPIIICSIAVVVIVSIVFAARFAIPMFTGIFIKDFDYDFGDVISTTYDIDRDEAVIDEEGEINSIKLDLAACEVNFKVKEGSGLLGVEYSGEDKFKPDVTFENGELVAVQKGINNTIRIGIHDTKISPTLDIILGTDVDLESIEMNINAGDIDMRDIKTDYLYGEFNAGNIIIKDCEFGKADLEANAGNISITDSELGVCTIDTDAGNIEVNKSAFDSIEVETNFGNVEIEGVDDLEKYDIEAEVDAGFVQVGGRSSGSYYSTSGNGSGSIKVNVNAGNVEIDD